MKPAHHGSALAAMLVMLLAFALLALSASVAAVASLAMAAQEIQSTHALEAAEAAIARTISGWPQLPERDPAFAPIWPDLSPDWQASALLRADGPDQPAAWPVGASVGDDATGFQLRHFTVTATGRALRSANSRLEQGFVVLVPAS